jgi:hypothetical protein
MLMNTSDTTPISNKLYDYIEISSGWFYLEDIYRALAITSEKDKTNIRVQCHAFSNKGLLVKDKHINGRFRKPNTALVESDILSAEVASGMDIQYPLHLEKLFLTMPKSIILLAGSTGSGKSAFAINFLMLNQWKHLCHYFSSELTPGRLKRRLLKVPNFADISVGFKFYERYDNYADVVFPDDINVIDFLDVDNATPYMIGNEIKDIWMKLKTGIAFILIQKKSAQKDWGGKIHEVELGVGGRPTIDRASIYLIMDNVPENKLKIIKVKEFDGINPHGLEWKYNLVNGVEFVNIRPPEELYFKKDGIGF